MAGKVSVTRNRFQESTKYETSSFKYSSLKPLLQIGVAYWTTSVVSQSKFGKS